MTTLLVEIDDDRKDDGPAMSALNERERAFCLAMIRSGCSEKQAEACAAAAGYANPHVSGWQLMRRQKILVALHEEAEKRLLSGALLGVNVMMEIAMTVNHKDRYKAAKELAAINGFISVNKSEVVVKKVPTAAKEILDEILGYAQELGIDVSEKQLLAAAGIQDAEFEEVTTEWAV